MRTTTPKAAGIRFWRRASLGLSAGLIALGVVAQEEQADRGDQDDEFDVALQEWDQEQVYQGWSAEEFLDEAEVYGQEGEEIGTVENLLINEAGQIVALVAQVGGFWDIGDTHVAVPWDEATFDGYDVMTPITEENAEDYSIFQEAYFSQIDVGDLATVEDDLRTGFDIWKATDLIDDYAVLENGEGYGYVNDLIFDNDGMLQSVVVNATAADYTGYYAYPWYGYDYADYAWHPGLDYYTLPYNAGEIGDVDTAFDYGELEGGLY